jgi:uncharacterized protein YbjT (DUF2867 family)
LHNARLLGHNPAMAVAVTGATGYIGRRVVQLAATQGVALYALSRHPVAGTVSVPYDLSASAVHLPTDVTAVIHLAHDNAEAGGPDEIAAARTLIAALPPGARLVFVSSQSANERSPSHYGRTKWAIEQLVSEARGISVRPGLVYGGIPRGLFLQLCNLVRQLPVLPWFVWPRPIAQPVHVDDLGAALLRAAQDPSLHDTRPREPMEIGSDEPMPFDRFLAALARERFGRSKPFVPVPLGLLATMLVAAERVTGRSFSASRLRSLAMTQPMRTADDLATLQITLRPLDSGLRRHPDVRRRRLIFEAALLLRYFLRATPHCALIARYVRHVEADGDTAIVRPDASPRIALLAVAMLDRPGFLRSQTWSQRLDLAMHVAEASPQGFGVFVPRTRGRLVMLRTLGSAMLRECGLRCLHLFAARWAARFLLRTDP